MASVLTQRRYFYFSMPKPSKGQTRNTGFPTIYSSATQPGGFVSGLELLILSGVVIIFHYLLSSMTTSSLVTALPV